MYVPHVICTLPLLLVPPSEECMSNTRLETRHSIPEYRAFPHDFAKHFLLTVHFYGRRLYENQNGPKYLHYARTLNVYNDPKYFVRISNIKSYQNQSGDCSVQTCGPDVHQNPLSLGTLSTMHINVTIHLSQTVLRVWRGTVKDGYRCGRIVHAPSTSYGPAH